MPHAHVCLCVCVRAFACARGGGEGAGEGVGNHPRPRCTCVQGKWGVDNGVAGAGWDHKSQRWEAFDPASGVGPLNRGFDTFYGLYNSAHNHYS
jgi:hypothetical protein